MPELRLLCLEIVRVFSGGRRNYRHPVIDREPVSLQPDELARIVGHHAHRAQAEIEQYLRADSVVAQIWTEAERLVRLDGVLALVLQLVGLELVQQTDAAPFLIEIYDDTAPFRLDHRHRSVQLPAAIAAQRVEHVPGEALGVHSDEHARLAQYVSMYECDVLVLIDVIAIADDAPLAVIGRKPCLRDAMHQSLGAQPVRDELRDRDEGEPVLAREELQLWSPSRASVLVQYLADDASGTHAGEPRK